VFPLARISVWTPNRSLLQASLLQAFSVQDRTKYIPFRKVFIPGMYGDCYRFFVDHDECGAHQSTRHPALKDALHIDLMTCFDLLCQPSIKACNSVLASETGLLLGLR
jgi:hypothetical protein